MVQYCRKVSAVNLRNLYLISHNLGSEASFLGKGMIQTTSNGNQRLLVTLLGTTSQISLSNANSLFFGHPSHVFTGLSENLDSKPPCHLTISRKGKDGNPVPFRLMDSKEE